MWGLRCLSLFLAILPRIAGGCQSFFARHVAGRSVGCHGKLVSEIRPHRIRALHYRAAEGIPGCSAALDNWLLTPRPAAQGTPPMPKHLILLDQVQNLLPRRNGKPVGVDTIYGWVRQSVRGATGGMVKLQVQRIGGRTHTSQAWLETFIRGCTTPMKWTFPADTEHE